MGKITLPENAKLLLIKLSAIGDIIESFPFFNYIRTIRPDISIDWVVTKHFADLLKLNRYIDGTIHFERKISLRKHPITDTMKIYNFIKTVRSKKYDAVIDLQGLTKSSIIAMIARSKIKIGFKSARELKTFAYNHIVYDDYYGIHDVQRYITVLEEIDIKKGDSPIDWGIRIDPHCINMAKDLVRADRYMILNPGGGWENKRWPFEKFTELADIIRKKIKIPVVMIGSEKEKNENPIPDEKSDLIIDIRGKTDLITLAAVIKNSELIVSADSGPMHIAAALDKKIIALFAPTSPAKTGPYTDKAKIIVADCDLTPCFMRKCPKDIFCISKITTDSVFDAINSLL